MHFKVGAATDVGRRRSQNQDNFLSLPELGIFVVADGMGGHHGGEIASRKAVESLQKVFEDKITNSKDPVNVPQVLREAVTFANTTIQETARQDPSLKGMGTTLTCLFFHEDHLFIGQVGDSRCYLIEPESIWQLTRDHSLVQEKLRAGLITREQLRTDPMRNVITRSLGYEARVEADIYTYRPQPQQLFLICSDGLSGQLDELTLLKIAQSQFFSHQDAESAVREYIQAANSHGGDDNITCILVQKV